MNEELLAQAQAGDAGSFQRLIAPHRRELRAHCYRMLGALQDAEDALQETWLAAWQGLGGFERRASLRSWLFRIATHRCLNARRTRRRKGRPFDVPGVVPPEPTRLGEVAWLEPLPEEALEAGLFDLQPGPEARLQSSESISLGFVTALQLLPHRQLAVLALCDLLEFEASEVAGMLDSTVDGVNSALKRARANLKRHLPPGRETPPPAPRSFAETELMQRFTRAWEAADVEAVVALLTDDVFISMPPITNEYVGREPALRFCAALFEAGRRFLLVPTRANGQPAFGVYLRSASGPHPGVGLYVLELRGERIAAMVRFERHLLGPFGLEAALPAS